MTVALFATAVAVASAPPAGAQGEPAAARDEQAAARDESAAARDEQAAARGEFAQCVARLQDHAVERGIGPGTAERVLSQVSEIERVISADRSQPEFVSTFKDYLERRVTPSRVARGRELLAEHRDVLDRVTREYGVPGQYLVALWGMETAFGRVLGSTPVFDSLATLACDDRRSAMFTAELVNALRIVDRGDVDEGKMIGSWAGAMGQTQFMPSSYLDYAVDGDGDSRVDLWDSLPDAFASAANYLSRSGWQRGFRWGREVVLPEGFDFGLAGLERAKPLGEWRRLGVRDVGGSRVAALDMPASLLTPSGHRGPAFLVYANFHVIMRWNRSEHFALAVGHLADRIAGSAGLRNPPPDAPPLARAQVLRVQQALAAAGYDGGEPDGIPGPATRAAVRAYQRDHGLVADGFVDRRLLESLDIE